MLRAIKNYFRRRQLTRRGIVCQRTLATLTSGDRSGVWTVWPDLLGRHSVVYSFGVGDNLAWDLAMTARFGMTLHAFDPTPASAAWVASQSLPSGLFFHPTGLAGHDGMLRLALPCRGSRFNFRPVAQSPQPQGNIVEVPVSRLATHLELLGHDHLDVLKLDIEGGEYAALDDLLASHIPVHQILVEFHHHFPGIGIARTERAVKALADAGYEIFHISDRGLEMSFVSAAVVDRAEERSAAG
jgi:FkbM family methyltransferase